MTFEAERRAQFTKWLETFVEEKGLNRDHVFEVEGKDWGTNFIPLEVVIEAMKATSRDEQSKIFKTVIMIDIKNGDVMDYFKHLAQALAL